MTVLPSRTAPSGRHGGPRGREHRAVAALQRRVARRGGARAPGDQLRRGAVEDDLAGVHQRDLGARGADVLD
jgi:hypothetical protein